VTGSTAFAVEIAALKALCARAAEALDQWCEYGTYQKKEGLIAELRRAAG
jgi:hypothetical protein